jgi:hypothetical protein
MRRPTWVVVSVSVRAGMESEAKTLDGKTTGPPARWPTWVADPVRVGME